MGDPDPHSRASIDNVLSNAFLPKNSQASKRRTKVPPNEGALPIDEESTNEDENLKAQLRAIDLKIEALQKKSTSMQSKKSTQYGHSKVRRR